MAASLAPDSMRRDPVSIKQGREPEQDNQYPSTHIPDIHMEGVLLLNMYYLLFKDGSFLVEECCKLEVYHFVNGWTVEWAFITINFHIEIWACF